MPLCIVVACVCARVANEICVTFVGDNDMLNLNLNTYARRFTKSDVPAGILQWV